MLHLTDILSIVTKIIIYSGIMQGLYSAMVLTHTKLRNPANHYLAVLLVVLSASILHSVFIIPYFHQTMFQIKEPFIMLVVPFIWLYVKKLNEPVFHFRKKHLLHFVPFIVVMLFSLFFLLHHSEINNNQRFYSHIFFTNIIIYLIALVQYVFYMVYILKLIRSFKVKTFNELSNTENIDPVWLRIFMFAFLAVFFLLILMMVIAIHQLKISYFNNVVSVVFAFAIYVLGYKGLFQQTIFPVKIKKTAIEDSKEEIITETKIDEQLLKRLLDFMIQQKPYHDPELTLTSLASQINISRNQLSEIINSGTGGNFYDFVNKYRVEEVKHLMINPKYKDFTLLAIAYEAGFPSKSTFNSIFKKSTGLTPSGYKNRLR